MKSLCPGVSLRPLCLSSLDVLYPAPLFFRSDHLPSSCALFPPSSGCCRHAHRSPLLQRETCPPLPPSSPAKPTPLKRSPPASIQDEETKTGRQHVLTSGLIIIYSMSPSCVQQNSFSYLKTTVSKQCTHIHILMLFGCTFQW